VSRTCGTTTQNYQAAFWTQGNDPCTSSGLAGSGQPWIPTGNCGASATATATATPRGTATATASSTATVPPTPTPTVGPTATPAPGGELTITSTITSEDATTYHAKIVFANPNAGYVWNGTYFDVRSIEFKTTSTVTAMTYPGGGSPAFTAAGGVVTINLGYLSLFPQGTSVEVDVVATKAGAQIYPSAFVTHYVRGENIVYPQYPGLPASWSKGKATLAAADLIANATSYYGAALPAITDHLVLYHPPSGTQIQIGLAGGNSVNGATDAQAFIPTRLMAMGMAFVQDEFGINPNYLAALGTKENWAAGATQNSSFGGPTVTINGQSWIWPIQIASPDGPYQVETGNFGSLVKYFPDYFPPTAAHGDYTTVSADMNDPNWVSSAIVTGVSLTMERELLAAVPTADYTSFVAQAKDPWAEMEVLDFAFNRGMGSLYGLSLFSTNRAQALASTDLVTTFNMDGFASHVSTVRGMTDKMNKDTADIYDADLTWSDVQLFFNEEKTFFANGVPSSSDWTAMMADEQRVFNVLAAHWGGGHVSLRYDFLTLLRVAKQYRPQPYHPRPTGSDWYYNVGSATP
jgi:hypothetical protein